MGGGVCIYSCANGHIVQYQYIKLKMSSHDYVANNGYIFRFFY